MKPGQVTLLFLAWMAVFSPAVAQDGAGHRVELSGYIKDLQSVSFTNNADSVITSNLIHNRINFKWNVCSAFSARLDLRNRIYYGEVVKLFPGFGKQIAADDGYVNLTKLWVDRQSLVAVSSFDRALLNYSKGKVSFTAGRQRINWGISNIWNTNDLFNAYNFLDYDYEERPGVDAIRIQYFPKTFSSAEAAYKPSKEKDGTVAAALFKFNKWKYDFQFLGGLYKEDVALGAGWAGNIGEGGVKGEMTYFRNKNNFKNGEDDFTASLLFDYALKNAWYITASALYVQRPAGSSLATLNAAFGSLSAKSLMPYRYSFYAGVMKSITPILSLNTAVIYSPEDHATIFFPALAYSIAEDFDLDLTAQCFFSDQSGQYQAVGNAVFLRMRWSF